MILSAASIGSMLMKTKTQTHKNNPIETDQ